MKFTQTNVKKALNSVEGLNASTKAKITKVMVDNFSVEFQQSDKVYIGNLQDSITRPMGNKKPASAAITIMTAGKSAEGDDHLAKVNAKKSPTVTKPRVKKN